MPRKDCWADVGHYQKLTNRIKDEPAKETNVSESDIDYIRKFPAI